jgi:hypothetical protein
MKIKSQNLRLDRYRSEQDLFCLTIFLQRSFRIFVTSAKFSETVATLRFLLKNGLNFKSLSDPLQSSNICKNK